METCDKCGKQMCAADEDIHKVDMSAGPSPECPEGYGCEVVLCDRCWVKYCEGAGEPQPNFEDEAARIAERRAYGPSKM